MGSDGWPRIKHVYFIHGSLIPILFGVCAGVFTYQFVFSTLFFYVLVLVNSLNKCIHVKTKWFTIPLIIIVCPFGEICRQIEDNARARNQYSTVE